MNQFTIRKIDPETDGFLWEQHFQFDDPDAIARLLGIDPLEAGHSVRLDSREYAQIAKLAGLAIDDGVDIAELHYRATYPILFPASHTGRELLLMLQGKKPLSVFTTDWPRDDIETFVPNSFFSPHVESGRFQRYERVFRNWGGLGHDVLQVAFVVPGESWRVQAYFCLWELALKYGWNEGFERLEGYLLGYETDIDLFFTEKNR